VSIIADEADQVELGRDCPVGLHQRIKHLNNAQTNALDPVFVSVFFRFSLGHFVPLLLGSVVLDWGR